MEPTPKRVHLAPPLPPHGPLAVPPPVEAHSLVVVDVPMDLDFDATPAPAPELSEEERRALGELQRRFHVRRILPAEFAPAELPAYEIVHTRADPRHLRPDEGVVTRLGTDALAASRAMRAAICRVVDSVLQSGGRGWLFRAYDALFGMPRPPAADRLVRVAHEELHHSAVACADDGELMFSEAFLVSASWENVLETVVHELAHYMIEFCGMGALVEATDCGHAPLWVALAQALGGTGVAAPPARGRATKCAVERTTEVRFVCTHGGADALCEARWDARRSVEHALFNRPPEPCARHGAPFTILRDGRRTRERIWRDALALIDESRVVYCCLKGEAHAGVRSFRVALDEGEDDEVHASRAFPFAFYKDGDPPTVVACALHDPKPLPLARVPSILTIRRAPPGV